MSNFTNPVYFESTNVFAGGRRVYRLTRDLIWEVGFKGSGEIVLIKQGFMTDFLSIPFPFTEFVNNDGPYAAAGALHDFLYNKKWYSREECDQQLYDALVALKCKKLYAKIIWAIVRLFGAKYYSRPRFYVDA